MIRSDFHVESSDRVCHECGHRFAPGQEYMSALFEVEPDEEHPYGVVRMDFCEDHWAQNRAEWLAFWRTRVAEPEAPKKPRLAIDDERLLEVFFHLEGTEAPAKLDFRYVIGLMLIRKRRLKMEGTRQRGGRRYMIVRKSRSKQTFELMDRELSDDAVLAVSREIGTLLDLVESGEMDEESTDT